MPLRFRARLSESNCWIFHHGLSLLVTILLLSGGIAAQDNRQTQEEAAKKLMVEGLQLVADGSPASLSKAIEKLESAKTLLHSLNLRAGEGAMLSMLG
jgi:hypothetical protein